MTTTQLVPPSYEELVRQATDQFLKAKAALGSDDDLLTRAQLFLLQREFLARLEQIKKNFGMP
jgi:hypothetical protein